MGVSKARAYQTTAWTKMPWLAAAVDFTFEMTVNGLMCALVRVAASAFQQAHREEVHIECAWEVSQPDVIWFQRWNLSTRPWA